MKNSRSAILARITEALRAPSVHAHAGGDEGRSSGSEVTIRPWLPRVSERPDEQLALFTRQCAILSTDLRHCADEVEAASVIAELARENAWHRVARHGGAFIDRIAALLPPELSLFAVAGDYAQGELEKCDAGVTECESLVAQTGSVCVTARSSGGRALSVLPPHHIVVARRAQLVPDLCAAFTDLSTKNAPDNFPSFISFISGPSRTGDIERILVLGAHGPRKLTILLLP
jgi:L-lactate dehydrogenase complex protein LldG